MPIWCDARKACTTDALVKMLHSWYEASDTPGSFIRIVLLDYSKAFDSIDHNVLLWKLADLGIPPHLVRWMGAFLLDRVQRVMIDDHYSSHVQPKGGVPQGTVTGPVNVLVQINDLSTTCPVMKYVDDGTMCEVCTRDSAGILQASVDVPAEWSKENSMLINPDKTKEIVICLLQRSWPLGYSSQLSYKRQYCRKSPVLKDPRGNRVQRSVMEQTHRWHNHQSQ